MFDYGTPYYDYICWLPEDSESVVAAYLNVSLEYSSELIEDNHKIISIFTNMAWIQIVYHQHSNLEHYCVVL
jgi:hypothetical protein